MSLMASKKSRTRCSTSSGGVARDYVGTFRTGQACFPKNFAVTAEARDMGEILTISRNFAEG
jgi:hypothetical protein